jgi:hypothetical protein
VARCAAVRLRREMNNVAIFPPCHVEEALRPFDELDLRNTPREGFVENARANIMASMAGDIARYAADPAASRVSYPGCA